MNETRFVVFTAGFNSATWVRKNILSVKKQQYENYIHIIVDDATTDDTSKIIEENKHDKLIVYRNEENIKWVSNALQYLLNHIESEEDVIVVVDMDDWLAHENVLSTLNKIYNEKKVWLTYGNYAIYDGKNINGKHIPKPLIDKKTGCFIHLRTFKSFLWNAIKENDLKDSSGNFVSCTYDRAIMYPMLDMCSLDKIYRFEEILYIYNSNNTLNVGKIMRQKQRELKKWFLNKPHYKELKR